jgi:signal transduction histidine kinase
MSSRGSWLELCYALVALPVVGWVGGWLVFLAWGGSLALLSFPMWGWAAAGGDEIFGWSLGYAGSSVVHVAFGAGALYAAPWLSRGVAAVQVAMARLLLEPGERERLSARVDTLEETRAGMVAAADAERRRIERDLHDGAQQRLVALAMTLGRAKATDDPVHTRRLVAEAHGEAKEALVELRNLARGIHPAVLTDRGLDAAVSALAARCPIPVAVDVDLPYRASPASEAIAYFVVAEALTNVAKHARATRAWLTVEFLGDRLVVEVLDNGIGGAIPTGIGIGGLRDRVRAVDGDLHLASPMGGGTTLRVELPCER